MLYCRCQVPVIWASGDGHPAMELLEAKAQEPSAHTAPIGHNSQWCASHSHALILCCAVRPFVVECRGHGRQDHASVPPGIDRYVSAGQGEHGSADTVSLYDPGVQGEHVVHCAVTHSSPTPQNTHS
eukprot:3939786-Rhodomonas_salina.1